MAQEEAREAEALEWAEANVADVADVGRHDQGRDNAGGGLGLTALGVLYPFGRREKRSSRKKDSSILWRQEKMEFGLVGQEEFQPQQDRHPRAGRITAGELGEQGQGAAKVRRLMRRQPTIDAAQVADLTGPGSLNAHDGLPRQALMMDVVGHHGERRSRIQPADLFGGCGLRR
jgi:hypothetical protein